MLDDHDTPTTPTRRVPLTLISGMATTAADHLAAAFRAVPGTAVVHHNLRQVTHGVVRRRVQFGAHEETTVLELAHGCVSCTLRQDLLPLLRSLAQRPLATDSPSPNPAGGVAVAEALKRARRPAQRRLSAIRVHGPPPEARPHWHVRWLGWPPPAHPG